jgi:hypothetical protein
MANFITSKENKEVLWNVLYNNKLFNNIPESNFNNIQSIFEKTVIRSLDENKELFTNNIDSINESKNIIAMNKIILQNIIVNINKYKKSLLTPIEIKETLKAEKLEEFDKELIEKKVSFDELITLKKPEVIDFSDTKEEPLTSNNMNELLERMQKERNITFPMDSTNSVELVDLNNFDPQAIEVLNSESEISNDVKQNINSNTNAEYYSLNNKIDKMSNQLAQLLANQMLIMDKLNTINREN